MQVALGFFDFRTRENGEAFAVRMQVENPNKVRQEHLSVRPRSRLRRSKRASIDRVIRNHDSAVGQGKIEKFMARARPCRKLAATCGDSPCAAGPAEGPDKNVVESRLAGRIRDPLSIRRKGHVYLAFAGG